MTTAGPQDPNASRRILARAGGALWARAQVALQEGNVVDPGPPALIPSLELPFQLDPEQGTGGHFELSVFSSFKGYIAGGAVVTPHLVIHEFPDSAIPYAVHIELTVLQFGASWLHAHDNWHIDPHTSGILDLGIDLGTIDTDAGADLSWLAPAARTAAGGSFTAVLTAQGNWDA